MVNYLSFLSRCLSCLGSNIAHCCGSILCLSSCDCPCAASAPGSQARRIAEVSSVWAS